MKAIQWEANIHRGKEIGQSRTNIPDTEIFSYILKNNQYQTQEEKYEIQKYLSYKKKQNSLFIQTKPKDLALFFVAIIILLIPFFIPSSKALYLFILETFSSSHSESIPEKISLLWEATASNLPGAFWIMIIWIISFRLSHSYRENRQKIQQKWKEEQEKERRQTTNQYNAPLVHSIFEREINAIPQFEQNKIFWKRIGSIPVIIILILLATTGLMIVFDFIQKTPSPMPTITPTLEYTENIHPLPKTDFHTKETEEDPLSQLLMGTETTEE